MRRKWTAKRPRPRRKLRRRLRQRQGELRNEVAGHPLVRAVLDTFPGATIAAVRERFVAATGDAEPAASDAADDFEDDGASAEEDEP